MANQNDPHKNLFIYIKMFFEQPEAFRILPEYVYKKHWFMLNRFLAKGFPKQAALLNIPEIDSVSGTLLWHQQLSKNFNKTPKFIYTKAEKPKKTNRWWPNENTIEEYCTTNQISRRDFKLMMNYGDESFINVVKSLDRMLNFEIGKEKKSRKKNQRTLL